MPQETPTNKGNGYRGDYEDRFEKETRRATSGIIGEITKSFDLFVRLFDKENSLTPKERQRARRFGVTALAGLVFVTGAITGVTLATGPKTPEIPKSPYITAEDQSNLEQATRENGPNERIVGEFTIDERGESPTEALEEFLGKHPEIKVDDDNIKYSQWSSLESGRLIGTVQPGESIQVTLDDPNEDGREEVVLQRPIQLKDSDK